MPSKGKPIVVIDRYTRAVIARYPSVKEAAEDLSIPAGSIYVSISSRTACYEAYFVYEKEMGRWRPHAGAWMRVNGLKVSRRLEELRRQNTQNDGYGYKTADVPAAHRTGT